MNSEIIIDKILNNQKLKYTEIFYMLGIANDFILIRIISKYKNDIIKYIKNPSYAICYFSVLKNKYNFRYVPNYFKQRIYQQIHN